MSNGSRLTIILRPNGDIELEGPINNKMLCYALLELARDSIVEHHRRSGSAHVEGGKIEKPSDSDVRSITSRRGT